MSIKFEPSQLIKKMAPRRKVAAVVTNSITVNKLAIQSLARTEIPLEASTLTDIALKVIRQYKKRRALEIQAGATHADATQTALNDKALMVQRVQNAAAYELTQQVKDTYDGEFYIWLPSTANIPDPLHQLNYGKTFQLGVGDDNGEDPGDRYGCQCGMQILVKGDTLEL